MFGYLKYTVCFTGDKTILHKYILFDKAAKSIFTLQVYICIMLQVIQCLKIRNYYILFKYCTYCFSCFVLYFYNFDMFQVSRKVLKNTNTVHFSYGWWSDKYRDLIFLSVTKCLELHVFRGAPFNFWGNVRGLGDLVLRNDFSFNSFMY